MTIELTMLALAIVLGLVQITLAAQASTRARGTDWNLGPRDEVLPPLVGVAGRLDRAYRNFLETFPLFAAAVLIAAVAGKHSWLTVWGSVLYLAARIVYVPLYVYGIRVARSAVWSLATLGLALVLIGLI